MLSADHLAAIRSEGEKILSRAREDRDRPIPQYPDWTMADLVAHLGSIHGRTALICREGPVERPTSPRLPQGQDVVDWYRDSLEEMLAALEESDPDTPVWGFWPNSCVGLWERRMVIETGLHRWDADQAFTDPDALIDVVASSGLEELGDMWMGRMGELPALQLIATDLGRSWTYGTGPSIGLVTGSASDLYLRLMSRPSPVVLPESWAESVDGLEPPPKPAS